MTPDFKDFVGIYYYPGKRDCYGLIRRIAWEKFGVRLRNYARPEDFAYLVEDAETGKRQSLMDLLTPNWDREGFVAQNGSWKELAVGDCFLFTVGETTVPNHCGMYIGNNAFIHHLYGKMSQIEALTPWWKSATVQVLRHPGIYKKAPLEPSLDFMEIVNPNVRRRLQRAKEEMESRRGALRTDSE